jgi:hypothetical protein
MQTNKIFTSINGSWRGDPDIFIFKNNDWVPLTYFAIYTNEEWINLILSGEIDLFLLDLAINDLVLGSLVKTKISLNLKKDSDG